MLKINERILYTVAFDINENLFKDADAEKGNEFICPVCKDELILRKSVKKGKGSKRPHFALNTEMHPGNRFA